MCGRAGAGYGCDPVVWSGAVGSVAETAATEEDARVALTRCRSGHYFSGNSAEDIRCGWVCVC